MAGKHLSDNIPNFLGCQAHKVWTSSWSGGQDTRQLREAIERVFGMCNKSMMKPHVMYRVHLRSATYQHVHTYTTTFLTLQSFIRDLLLVHPTTHHKHMYHTHTHIKCSLHAVIDAPVLHHPDAHTIQVIGEEITQAHQCQTLQSLLRHTNGQTQGNSHAAEVEGETEQHCITLN